MSSWSSGASGKGEDWPAASPAESLQQRRRRSYAIVLSPRQSISEWLALALLLACSIGGSWMYGAVRPSAYLSLGACAGLALLIPLALRLTGRREDLQIPPGGWMLVIVALYAAVRVPWSAVPHDAWLEVLRLTAGVAAYWAWSNLAGHHGRWRWLLGALILSMSCMAWYALIQHGHDSRLVLFHERPPQYGMRASGAYFCPNHFANLIQMLLPICLALLACRAAGFAMRSLAGYGMLVGLPALYLTQSRSGWMAAMASFGVTILLLAWRRSARRMWAAALLAPLAILAVSAAVWLWSPDLKARFEAARKGDIRLAMWQDTLKIIQDAPLLGHGPGSYRWMYAHYQENMLMYLEPIHAHNEYLETLAELGVVGLALFAAAGILIAWRPVSWLRRADREKDAFLGAGLAGCVAGSLVHAVFDFNFHIFANAQTFVALAGIVAAGFFASGDWRSRSASRAGVSAAHAFGLLLVVAAIGGNLLHLTARHFDGQGDEHRKNLDYEKARRAYARAIRLEPFSWQPWLGMAETIRSQAFWNRDPASKAEQQAESLRYFEGARQRNPWAPESLYGMSKVLMAQGEIARSLDLLREIVEMVPHHAFYWSELGLRLRMSHQYEEALRAFQRSKQIEPSELAELNIRILANKIEKLKADPSAPR